MIAVHVYNCAETLLTFASKASKHLRSQACRCLQIKDFGKDMTPIKRAAQPKEYGPPAVFLAHEPSSSNIVACILNVTGGMFM